MKFKKGEKVRVTSGRWKGERALIVGTGQLYGAPIVRLSRLGEPWDSPIVATQPENLARES